MSCARLLAVIALAGAIAGAAACSHGSAQTTEESAGVTELDPTEWLDKAARVLRNGDGLGPHDDVAHLVSMSKADVVDLWMKDPRFGDAVLGFNLYYLGRSLDQVRTSAGAGAVTYDPRVFEFPQALMAAKAALEGGDYFALYDAAPPYVAAANPGLAAGVIPGERVRVLAEMDDAIQRVMVDRTDGCARYSQAGLQATNRMRLLGFAPAVTIRDTWLNPHPAYPLTVDCSAGSPTPTDQLIASMRAVRASVGTVWASVEGRVVPAKVASLSDLTVVPVVFDGLPPLVSPLGATFFQTLPSTSTNFHRKRAAYMLKTYFCDDLTPLDIPAPPPSDGGDDVHASNPICQACHYRLDPMGALFRTTGVRGRDFSGQRRITFDDMITFDGDAYDRYLGQWQNPDGTFRAGYWVLGANGQPEREPGWTEAEGDTLPGLWSYMRRAPTVKSCFVRKLAEYVLGPQQVYDRDWLAQISAGFASGPESGAGFRDVLKAILMSKTFSIHDPQKGVCYDVPSDAPPNRAPCAIAHVVSANCASCHASADGPGHLDFTRWIDIGGGQYSWFHTDDDGHQLSRKESLGRMLDRITSTDVTLRMPLFRAISSEDYLTFRDWLTNSLENSQP